MTPPSDSPARVTIAAIFGVCVVAIAGMSATDLGEWYQSLRQPPWKPPDWLFGPAWTLIYAFIVAGCVKAWRAEERVERRAWMLAAFVGNGLLNIFWSVLFFRLQRPDWALLEISLLWLSIVVLMGLAYPASRSAALLFLPYLAWVTFAAALNLSVVRLNSLA